MSEWKDKDWILKAKFARSVIEQSLAYWNQDVKDSTHYTNDEKIIFLIMNVMGHYDHLQSENERLKERCGNLEVILKDAVKYWGDYAPQRSKSKDTLEKARQALADDGGDDE